MKPWSDEAPLSDYIKRRHYISELLDNDQLRNVRKTSKKYDLIHLYAVNVMCTLALDVMGKYS
ncbi:hypothetical protein CEW81_06930 [Kluyvera genomosp. 3]|uniref:Uncharacterized protein n=1 Tax=Kluyvera genomosp. 3 TaxID=2774055 RepID=A0A248KGM1_9ENTR|nr:hypothetical protein CEW81_06930 [Kluyvera genomosp. 3]